MTKPSLAAARQPRRYAAPAESDQTAPGGFLAVGIGVSASGFHACRKLFDAMPDCSGMAFIVVQHLDAAHPGMMAALLSGHRGMAIRDAEDNVPIEPETVYLGPPGMYLAVYDGLLRLSPPPARHGARLPFDFLLPSLAACYGPRAAAVVLSGSDMDGSIGIRAIREHAGLIIAQRLPEAIYDGMPASAAIATGMADAVLPLAEIPARLIDYARSLDGSPERGPAADQPPLETITAREEIQSLNEELSALNEQLQKSLERQRSLSNDLENLLYSTDEAMFFLDAALNIRLFTPATKALFNIVPGDIGRPLTDLTTVAGNGTLAEDAAAVQRTTEPSEREIEVQSRQWLTRRILPYRTHEGRVEGVIVTFTDVTKRKLVAGAPGAAREQAERANLTKSSIPAAGPILTDDIPGGVQRDKPSPPWRAHPYTGGKSIGIIDDDEPSRTHLSSLLETIGWQVTAYSSAEAFLRDSHHQPYACLLLDARPPGMSGIDLLKLLHRKVRRMPVIMVTPHGDIQQAVTALHAGAADFIETPFAADELFASIDAAIELTSNHNSRAEAREDARRRIGTLTARQCEIMVRVLAGQPSKTIATHLGISQRTVEVHRAAIMARTRTKSLPALARLALAADLPAID